MNLDETDKTPKVRFNPEKGILEIKGRFIPENAIEYFIPIYEWLDEYAKTPAPNTEVHLQLEYLNDSSSKCMFDVLKKLMFILKGGNQVEINWYYPPDDEDIYETGEDYQSIFKIPFKFIETEE